MEERIVDDPRKIKVKRNAAGGVEDATDALAAEEGEAAAEEELLLELPEGVDELDEDLIGLAPSRLERELERRKKEAAEMAAERDKLLQSADALYKKGQYRDAEPLYAQAVVIDPSCEEAERALWLCRTEDLKSAKRLSDPAIAEEFSAAGDGVRALVLNALGAKLKAERDALEQKAAPLRERVKSAQSERRTAFIANRNYYRVRLLIWVAVLCVLVIATCICGSQIVHVRGNTPAYLTIAFGALALLDLIPVIFCTRKYVVAQRFVSENEKLDSTEDGAALAEMEEKLNAYALLLERE